MRRAGLPRQSPALEASPDTVRVGAAYVADQDIRAMAEAVGYLPGGGL